MNCDQWGAGLIKGDVWQHGKAGHRGTLSINLVSGNTITIAVDTITIDIISIDNVNLPSSPLSSSPLTSSPLISFKYHWHLCHWHNHLYRGGGKKELLAWTPCRQPWRQPWRTLGLECRLSNWFFDFIDDVVMQEYWESRGTEADPWHECGSTEVNISFSQSWCCIYYWGVKVLSFHWGKYWHCSILVFLRYCGPLTYILPSDCFDIQSGYDLDMAFIRFTTYVSKIPDSFSPDDTSVLFWMVWEQLHKASWAQKLQS